MSNPTDDPNQQPQGFQPEGYGSGAPGGGDPHSQSQPFQQQYPQYPGDPYGSGGGQAGFYNGPPRQPSFLGSLFDLKFTQFVTLRVIPVLYTISLVVISIIGVVYFFGALIAGFAAFGEEDGGPVGVLLILTALVVVPLFWLIYVVFARVIFEFFLSIVRIADNTDPRHRRF